MMRQYEGLIYVLIAIAACALLALAVNYALAAPSLVGLLEAQYGSPGTTRVLPECSCTVRYVGTKVEGRDYFVHFRQLD